MHALLANDNQKENAELAKAFAAAGHTTAIATSRLAATHLWADSTFDAVLVDQALPDGDGLEWCRQVRANGSSIPIVIMSHEPSRAEADLAAKDGASEYLPRPFRSRELVARCETYDRRRRGVFSIPVFDYLR